MSSSIYLGVPGSGKSFGIVKHSIIPALQRGRRVVCNIPLKVDEICNYLGKDVSHLIVFFTAEDFAASNFWFTVKDKGETFTKHGDLIVIDEAHKYLINFRDTHPLFVAIREQRHYANADGHPIDIIFATQAYGDIPRKLAPVCDAMYVMERLVELGQEDRYIVHFYKKCSIGPDRQSPVSTMNGVYEPEFYALYSSFSHAQQASSAFEGFQTEKLDGRMNVWNQPIKFLYFNLPFTFKHVFIAAIPFTILTMGYGIWSALDIAKDPTNLVKAKTQASAPASTAPNFAPNSATSTAPSTPAKSVNSALASGESSQFRLVGFYQFNGVPVAVVSDNDGKYRYLLNSFERVFAGPASHIKYNGEIIAPWTGTPNKVNKSSNSSIFGAMTK